LLSKKQKYSHSNLNEIIKIVKIFSEHEYNVDIIEYRHQGVINYHKYHLIFGFGDIFEESFYTQDFSGKRIFYATGAHPEFQNDAEIKRIKEFNRRHGKLVMPKRLPKKFWACSTTFSDSIFCYGNDWTISTYQKFFDGLIMKITPSNHSDFKFEKKDFQAIKKNFLWIGAAGAIHKGLDLCIETFLDLPEFHLDIIGPIDGEIFEMYGNEKKINDNILFHGFMDIRSVKFKDLMEKNTFVICPSCSEGSNTSVILAMRFGLIPVLTKECGIDLDNAFEIINIDLIELKKQILFLGEISINELEERSDKIYQKSNQKFNLESFEKSFNEALSKFENFIGIK
jgi:hypothetical protein